MSASPDTQQPTHQTRICRFLTTPPLPPLKVAISITQHSTIDQLISKINQTILNEADSTEFADLIQPPNPSHRLVLELPDGCRLPPTEPSSIIPQDQLVTIRLCARPQPQLRLEPSAHSFMNRLASQPNFPSSNHQLHDHPSRRILTDQPIHSGHQSILQGSSSQIIRPSQFNPITHGTQNSFFTQASSLELSPQNTQGSHQHFTESFHLQSGTRSLFSSRTRFTSLPVEQSASHHLIQLPSTHQIEHSFSQQFEADPRLQTQENHTSPGRQALEFPYRSPSTSSEEPKPNLEELDQSTNHQQLSSPQVPRVRSHIAAFRKIAFRHYLSSESDSSFDGDGSSSSSDDSDDFASSSRKARGKKNKADSRQSHSRKVKLEQLPPRRISTRHSMGGLANRRFASSRPKRKSAPVRFDLPSDDDERVHQSAIIRDEIRRGKQAHSDDSSSSHHHADHSFSPLPRKHHISQRVQVVIPPSPGLVAPAYLKRKRTQPKSSPNLSPKESNIPPSPSNQSSNCTSSSTNSTNLNAQEDSSELVDEPSQSAISRSSSQSFGPANSLDPEKGDSPSKSCGPTKAKSLSPTKTNSMSPDRSAPSLSAGRTVRSVYQIYVHDMKFKSASGQGPQRIPSSSSGLNDNSTLRQVIERLKLDQHASWKLIIGDKVWLSEASSLKRAQTRGGQTRKLDGLLDGRIVQINWSSSLKELGVFPLSNLVSEVDVKPLQIQVIRNWDLK
ncbi:hypothetical protein PGTUg99_004394 [Puccinia graminis f. sp. tritici]|uniref:Uncharacterized protein n=1 Tax=Puccinia graminis f. sp. tritici TaxID=56615 RepID=A0A5B0RWT4_PUCGR|nr:hypothetical protein PGTUg99_004394 [Puccinia graminis f. sp. tritici]